MNTIDLLKNQPLTEGLSEEELLLLSYLLEDKVYPKDGVIFEENERSDDIYFIVDGEVELSKWDEPCHQQYVIAILKKGDMFGEMAFLDSSPRSTRVTSHGGPTHLLKLSRNKLDITSIYNKIVKNIALIGVHRLRLTDQKFINNC